MSVAIVTTDFAVFRCRGVHMPFTPGAVLDSLDLVVKARRHLWPWYTAADAAPHRTCSHSTWVWGRSGHVKRQFRMGVQRCTPTVVRKDMAARTQGYISSGLRC